jgi:hypothetical protein
MGLRSATLCEKTLVERNSAAGRPDCGSARRYLVGQPRSNSRQRNQQDPASRRNLGQCTQSRQANRGDRSTFNWPGAAAADRRAHALLGAEFRGGLRPATGRGQTAPDAQFGSALDDRSAEHRGRHPARSGTLIRRTPCRPSGSSAPGTGSQASRPAGHRSVMVGHNASAPAANTCRPSSRDQWLSVPNSSRHDHSLRVR